MTIAIRTHELIDTIGEQDWLKPVGDTLQQAVDGAFDAGGAAGQQIEDALHGKWIGHPLHPILTDIPLGSWTAAAVLDALEGSTGNQNYGPGADMAVMVGFIGAVGAAVAGITDWKDTSGEARQIGLVHGLLNVAATGLYAGSILERRRGSRSSGRNLAFAGFTLSLTSAALGGDLVFRQSIGVDHADELEQSQDFTPVLAVSELAEGTLQRVDFKGTPVVLARQKGQVYALAERCSHLGGPLAEGKLEDGGIRCPWHGSCFALEDGHVIEGPSVFPQPHLDAREHDGQIEVRVSK